MAVLAIVGIPVVSWWHGASPATRSEAEGAVPDGTTVFDTDVPGVARLDPALLTALRVAADDAAGDGIEIVVNSGWRSAAYQAELLDEAIADHGGRDEAARWVAAPDRSAHVSGNAVDVGPAEAREWLTRHGSRYGLCPTYDNEPWHYELRPDAADDGCPAPYTDPTYDPRMRP
ncbi:MAG: M15 family metallopeptidase [Acidimicrobiales bacterium]